MAYGRNNNDGFDDESLYPQAAVDAAIQRAEEAIEKGCGRSFTERKRTVRLFPANPVELPVVDVYALECPDPSVRLVSYCQATGVTEPVMATLTYGRSLDAQVSEAATRLAAMYLRPRSMPENARGTSAEGVYISYELATGEDGSWTGIPYVDAAIAQNRAHRAVVA